MYIRLLVNKFNFAYFFLLLIFPQFQLSAQKIENNDRVKIISIGESNRLLRFQANSFTAVLLRSSEAIVFNDFKLVVGKDTLLFTDDSHAPEGYYQSNLLQFDGLITDFSILYEGQLKYALDLIMIDGSYDKTSVEVAKEQQIFLSEGCQPISSIIPQSTWREGLNTPSYTRSYTTVTNIIVHHSAGLNTVTDFRQAVRGIYLLHTEVNGWSDIGYNYLIAPDGSIFAGRDPLTGAQDNVIGAHFCGANSNTMGICLLGNYQEVAPTDTILSSLKSLLAWKINKEPQLAALGVNSHPLNSNLNQIAGHRDGCSTACPGESVYNKLESIRQEVQEITSNCTGEEPVDPDPEEPEEPEEPVDEDLEVVDLDVRDNTLGIQEYTLYPNPVVGDQLFYCTISKAHSSELKSIEMVSQWGNKVHFNYKKLADNRIRIEIVNDMVAGFYFLHMNVNDANIVRKILIL